MKFFFIIFYVLFLQANLQLIDKVNELNHSFNSFLIQNAENFQNHFKFDSQGNIQVDNTKQLKEKQQIEKQKNQFKWQFQRWMKKKLQRENELFLKPTSVIHIDDVTMTGEDVAIMIQNSLRMMIFCGKDMDLCELKEKEIIYKQPEPIKLNETKSREEEFEEQNRKFKELFESNGGISDEFSQQPPQDNGLADNFDIEKLQREVDGDPQINELKQMFPEETTQQQLMASPTQQKQDNQQSQDDSSYLDEATQKLLDEVMGTKSQQPSQQNSLDSQDFNDQLQKNIQEQPKEVFKINKDEKAFENDDPLLAQEIKSVLLN